MNEARARLRELLDDGATLPGTSVPELVERLVPAIPLGDLSYWVRPAVSAAIRDMMRSAGLVIDHGVAVEPGEARPIAIWGEMPLDSVLDYVRHHLTRQDQDKDSLRARVNLWLDAHPDVEMSVDDVWTLATKAA